MRMKKFGSLAVAAFSLALAACEDPLGTGGVPVSFSLTNRPSPDYAVSSESPRTVTVRGTFGFSGCDEADPGARVEGNTVIFRLEMERHSECPMALQILGYRAQISNIPAGTYQVRVEHVGTTDAWDGPPLPDGVRFTGNVTVE
ncbi:MAG TPA: hypothetical protein VFS20_01875 [Longimicrobium sp.]|nr:hypothetical protein [Longimicrobium sp.]